MPPAPARWSRSTSRCVRSSTRRADLAIAGGVYLEADVDFPLVFRQLNALSRSGTARPFGALADGMLPGEGAGVVILKRLRDAERDGDRIYALVQGVGIASDGRSQGLAAPSARGHARASPGLSTFRHRSRHRGLGRRPRSGRAGRRPCRAQSAQCRLPGTPTRPSVPGRCLFDDRPRHAGRGHRRVDQDGPGPLPPRSSADLELRAAPPPARWPGSSPFRLNRPGARPGFMPSRTRRAEPA